MNDLSPEQWAFLAALEACGQSITKDLARVMAPLEPEQYGRLLKYGLNNGWIRQTTSGRIRIGKTIPDSAMSKIKSINTKVFLALLHRRLDENSRDHHSNKPLMAKLLEDAGKIDKAAEIQLDLARDFLGKRDLEKAYKYQSRAVSNLHNYIDNGGDDQDRSFVSAALELSSLSFAVGRGMRILALHLRTAVSLAESGGYKRHHALACLHLGRLLTVIYKIPEALEMFSIGKEEVERLGDSDIIKAASEFLGLYYCLQGNFKEALVHFERVERSLSQDEGRLLAYPMILWNLGITLFETGQIPRALGFYQSYWQNADEIGLHASASIARAILGFSLAAAHKRSEALFQLEASLQEAREKGNDYSLFTARTGMAILLFNDGDIEASYNLLKTAFEEGKKALSAPIYISRHLLELLAAFERSGFDTIAEGWGYEEQLNICLTKQYYAVRGAALRQRAEDKIRSGEKASTVMEIISAGEAYLKRAGAAFALVRLYMTKARLYVREKWLEEARSLIFKIQKMVREMGLGKEFFPKDLEFLLDRGDAHFDRLGFSNNFMKQYFETLEKLQFLEEEDELLHAALRGFNQVLGGERGALFWSSGNSGADSLELRAGCNLTKREAASEDFESSMSVIRQVFMENRPILVRPQSAGHDLTGLSIKGMLCIPIKVGKMVRGVLYNDIYYVDDYLNLFPPRLMTLMANHSTDYVAEILERIHLKEELIRQTAGKSIQQQRIDTDIILGRSSVMRDVIDLTEKSARSEASILITGETGVGKELLVGKIHNTSSRSSGPLVIVDSTTIPENLVESELFGHEKGAFTGADSRKRGRMELAHKGTLFIDEIGELSLQVQAKLLRALESKAFTRVGGSQLIKSDFRLVAATNRSLSDEVKGERFRPDLYYRLNVIHLDLPPLRKRGDDILLLADYFLQYYASQYGRQPFELTRQDEECLLSYPWPGNVRELKNCMERSVILAKGDRLTLDIPAKVDMLEDDSVETLTLEEVQRRYIKRIIRATGGKIGGPDGAAARLGMKRSSLYTRMYKLGIK